MTQWREADRGVLLSYQTPVPYGKNRTPVLLAGVFNAILGGLNLLGGVGGVALAVLVWFTLASEMAAGGVTTTYAGGPPTTMPFTGPQRWLVAGVYGGPGLLCLVATIPQMLAGIQLLRRRPSAKVWGIIAGITSCCQLWLSCFYPIALACGVYTLVVCFMPSTACYLAAEEQVRQQFMAAQGRG